MKEKYKLEVDFILFHSIYKKIRLYWQLLQVCVGEYILFNMSNLLPWNLKLGTNIILTL